MKYKILVLSALSLTVFANQIEIPALEGIDNYNRNDAKRVTLLRTFTNKSGAVLPAGISNFTKLKTLVIAGKPVQIDVAKLPKTLEVLACKGCDALKGSFAGAIDIEEYNARY